MTEPSHPSFLHSRQAEAARKAATYDRRSRWVKGSGSLALALVAALVTLPPAGAEEHPKCAAAPPVLWGDGEHDDTAALNAWFRGETVLWAQTHEPVGSKIAGHDFLLSSTIYIHGGTGRKMERFRMVWPWRNEVVSGGTIAAGNDPDGQPV